MFTDVIYDTFFVNGEKFTIEDYDTNLFGVYHEDMFIGTCSQPNTKMAMQIVVTYYAKCHQ